MKLKSDLIYCPDGIRPVTIPAGEFVSGRALEIALQLGIVEGNEKRPSFNKSHSASASK